MKLKKIASLALAGVMAVSVLAGCSTGDNNSSSNGTPNQGETEVVPASAVISLLNSKQYVGSTPNPVQINFTADAQLESDLQEAVKMAGSTNGTTYVGYILNNYKAITGKQSTTHFKAYAYQKNAKNDTLASSISTYLKTNGMSATGIYDTNYYTPAVVTASNAVKDGTTNTYMMLVGVEGSASIQSPEAAVNQLMNSINSLLRNLDDDSFNGGNKTANTKYYDYSYTGTAGAVTGVSQNGAPVYYIAVTITQTVSVKTTPSV